MNLFLIFEIYPYLYYLHWLCPIYAYVHEYSITLIFLPTSSRMCTSLPYDHVTCILKYNNINEDDSNIILYNTKYDMIVFPHINIVIMKKYPILVCITVQSKNWYCWFTTDIIFDNYFKLPLRICTNYINLGHNDSTTHFILGISCIITYYDLLLQTFGRYIIER